MTTITTYFYRAGAQPVNNLVGDVVMPPPETASLGKFTDISVGMYTGTANVNIPLFTLTEGPLAVPMSLSYQTSGVQVGEPASMTGLGWGLNAGGRIMRTVMGKPDEAINGYRSRGATYAGIPNMNPNFPLQPGTSNFEAVEGIANGLFDGEADVFSFSFGGWSGKFYLDADGVVVLVPQQNIRIEPHFTSNPSLTGLRGFTVTTPDGAKYYFGIAPGNETPVVEELQSFTAGSSGSIFITAWMLLRIESFDATSRIDFSYTEERYGYKNRASCDTRLWSGNGCPDWQHFKVITRRLQRISSLDKTVDFIGNTPREDLRFFNEQFITDQHAKRLDAIEIKDNSVLCKRFDFSYDYWKDQTQYATGEPEDKRLRLLSVQERSCDGSIAIPPYSIQYYGADYLPHRLSRAIDHWGYYNGAEAQNNHNDPNLPPINETITYTGSPRTNPGNNALQSPGDPIGIYFPGRSNRETNPTAMTTGNLRSITFPTGGAHTFEYEANDYWGKTVEVNEQTRLSRAISLSCNTLSGNIEPFPVSFSAQELPRLQYRMRIRRTAVSCPVETNPTYFTVKLFAQGSSSLIASRTFSNNTTMEEYTSGALTAIFPQLQAGTAYRFEFEAGAAIANFQVVEIQTTEVWRNLPVGGLRVKSVAISDGSGQDNTIRKTYRYVNQRNPAQSSGILYNAPRYWVNFDNFPIHGGILGSPLYNCYNCTLFFDNSVVPLSGFEGSHIGYATVTEDHEGNGRRELVFFTETPSPGLGKKYQATEYPYPPEQLRVSAGNTQASSIWSEGDVRVSWEENQPVSADYTNSTGLMVKALRIRNEGTIGWQTYRIKTRIPYLVKENRVTTDGVETLSTWEYNGISAANAHYFPTAVSVRNSDGVQHRTETQYAAEQGNAFMLQRYMVGIPIKEVRTAGGIAGGYRKTYVDGYPTQYYEILSDGSELLKGSTSQYLNGLPADFTPMGAPTVQYQWRSNRMLGTQQFLDWKKSQEFYNNDQSRFLKKSTGIDGQAVEYEYDQLGRPRRISSRAGNIVTNLAYNYGGPNSVVSTTTYSDAPTQTLTEEFDGLGRPTRSIHNGVVKKEQFYDAFGRMWKKTYLPGNFTTYNFEDSPLSRVIRQIFPDGHFTQTRYGAQGNYYKTTTIDEKSNESSVLTEIVGRTHQTIDALGGTTTFSYAPYGEPSSVQPPSGSAYTYQYDNRRRLIYKKIPGARAQILRYYDENNLLHYTIDGKGQRIDHYYDAYLRERRTTLATVDNWDPESSSASHGAPGSDILITRYGEEFPDLPQIYKGRVRQTEAKLFGSGPVTASGFVQTLFSYDNFGRATTRTENFPLLPGSSAGTDTWNLTYNHADWLTLERRDHQGAASFVTARSLGYDRFGRTLFYTFSAHQPMAAVVSMTWNDRDQMTSKKSGFSLDNTSYRYNERGWLTDINDVMRERWETPYEICQGEAGEEETYEQEEKVPLDELLELLCKGETPAIRGIEPCGVGGDCKEETADYQVTLSVGFKKGIQTTDLFVHHIFGIGGQQAALPGFPYTWKSNSGATPLLSRDDSEALARDLRAWLDASAYRYDSVVVKPVVLAGKEGNLSLHIRIFGTNWRPDYLIFNYDKDFPYSRAHFVRSNIRLVPCGKIPLPDLPKCPGGLAQSPKDISFPALLYLLRYDDGKTGGPTEWRLDTELCDVKAPYERIRRIPLGGPDDRFAVLLKDGKEVEWSLEQLLKERSMNGLTDVLSIRRIVPKDEKSPCEPVKPSDCSDKVTEQQIAALAQIQNLLCNTNAAQLSYPVTLYQVALCNGGTTYVLGPQQLQLLPQPVQILGQIVITGPEQTFSVALTRRRPLFAMKFKYEPNGNISELQWKVTRQDVKFYENHYDPLNRLSAAFYGIEREVQPAAGAAYIERVYAEHYNELISYDPIGNIQKLSRRGLIPAADCFNPGLIDDLSYYYQDEEGRLTAVNDAAPEPYRQQGFKPRASGGPLSTHYQYDHNGNLTYDAHKGMQFDYNFLNLPRYISTPQGTLHFLYDATGRKWAKSGPEGIRFYAGNVEYLNSQVQHVAFSDGRIVSAYDAGGAAVEGRVEYFRTDHLGNTRLTFSDFNQDGVISWQLPAAGPTVQESEITSENHYYPFGLSQAGPWYASVAPKNKYRYNGKEWNDEWGLNMYDYGARGYMPDLGRWGQADPLAEKYYHISSYVYCANSPLNYLDPYGMDIYRYDDKTGAFSLYQKTDDNFDQVGKFKHDKKSNTYTLLTNKKTGEAKNRIDIVEKGILRDGANFMDKSNIIEVGGEGQATEAGVEAFAVNLSEMVGKEIAGAYFSKEGASSETTHITIGEYKENKYNEAKGHGVILWNKIFPSAKLDSHIKGFFHTHPSVGYSISDRLRPSAEDKKSRDTALKNNPNLQFYILTQPEKYGDKFPLKIPYKNAW